MNIIQCNLKCSWRALDLLNQYTREHKIAICIISEPPLVQNAARWFNSKNNLADTMGLGFYSGVFSVLSRQKFCCDTSYEYGHSFYGY